MIKIDSHQHFWQYNPAEHSWMPDQMPGLKKDFLPKDLAPLPDQIQFDGCISVQASQSIAERIMIGSDWPVYTLSGSYSATMKIVTNFTKQFSPEITESTLGANCIKFYNILK